MKTATPFAFPLLLALAACGAEETTAGGPDASGRPRLAFVTNCVAEFWAVADCGVEAARADFGIEVSVHKPPNGTAEEQQRILEDLMAKGVRGIALSPKDPDNMTGLLDEVAERALLVTHDSDAPDSRRLCYVGMDNYDAGRMCGRLVAEAVPDGGVVVILVGTLDQDNARGRRQGLIDELLGRDHDPRRFDPQDAVVAGDRFEIRATFTDQFDRQKCKAAAEDALTRWSDLDCMVGLFEYEPPLLLEAVRAAGRLDRVAIVAFDENEATLQGIVDGTIHGTVVQNPYEYAYRSLELLHRLLAAAPAEREALMPAGRFVDIPARLIRRDNVQDFWADLRRKTGRAPAGPK